MKKYILFLIITSLFLNACTYLNDKESLSTQECLKYKPEIEEQIMNNFTGKTGDGENGGIRKSNLEEIFYSPVLKKCLFVFNSEVLQIINGKEEPPYFSKGIAPKDEGLILFGNYQNFNGDEWHMGGYGEPTLNRIQFENEIKELKGE